MGISVTQISKSFGDQQVLAHLSFCTDQPQLVLLLGENGAGKSTFLKVLSGLARVFDGQVLLDEKAPSQQRKNLGYVSHQSMLTHSLTVAENLQVFRRLRGLTSGDAAECSKRWRLADILNKRVTDLSRGNQQRASLACHLVHSPKFIFLDEPSSALDTTSTELLKEQLLFLTQRGSTVIVATHDLARLGRIATRTVLLRAGNIALDSADGITSATQVESAYHQGAC